jgi:hypothetical protein
MATNSIIIDGFELTTRAGTPFTSKSKLLDKELAGIHLNFDLWDPEDIDQIDRILDKGKAVISDPFVGRVYEASIKRTLLSYQEDRPTRTYKAEIKEIEVAPNVNQLEINSKLYEVIRYKEQVNLGDEVHREAVLKLSQEEFDELYSLPVDDPTKLRRINVDIEPLAIELSGWWWSEHQNNGDKYIKLYLNILPAERAADDRANKLRIIVQARTKNLQRLLITLSARYERLVELLVENNLISRAEKDNLLFQEWHSSRIRDQFEREVQRVSDAEEILD